MNFIIFVFFVGVIYFLMGVFYIGIYFYVYQFVFFDIQVNWLIIGVCVVFVDFVYYWEYCFMYCVNIVWVLYLVYYLFLFFNILVVYCFGLMDGVWLIFFYLFLVFLGFNLFFVFFVEIVVQFYQIVLYMEVVRKFLKLIEWMMNILFYYRVYYGLNEVYFDKNYGGIFIVWDCLFGIYFWEDQNVVYGFIKFFFFVDFVIVFLYGFYWVGKKFVCMRSLLGVFGVFFVLFDWELGKK